MIGGIKLVFYKKTNVQRNELVSLVGLCLEKSWIELEMLLRDDDSILLQDLQIWKLLQ